MTHNPNTREVFAAAIYVNQQKKNGLYADPKMFAQLALKDRMVFLEQSDSLRDTMLSVGLAIQNIGVR